MLDPSRFRIEQADWAQARDTLLTIRFEVFVDEQGVPPELEEDADDPRAVHLLVWDSTDNTPVATGRLLANGHIGRMAVRRAWRGQGIGGAMLERLIGLARQAGLKSVFLNAQCAAEAFYRRHGFRPEGDVFEEAGIAHRRMSRPLA